MLISETLGTFLKVSSPAEEWITIADNFEETWQYPNCVGVIVGKHIVMQLPTNSGSRHYNYKHTYSIVVIAIAGPSYECLYADIGTNRRTSDGGVWNMSRQ